MKTQEEWNREYKEKQLKETEEWHNALLFILGGIIAILLWRSC